MTSFSPFGAARAYASVGLETSVNSADPHGLVLLMFDGAIESVGRARRAIEAGDVEAKGTAISRAIRILDEGLGVSLDERAGGELAARLSLLYQYMAGRLLIASLRNDIPALDEVSGLLGGLREAWAAISPRGQQARAA